MAEFEGTHGNDTLFGTQSAVSKAIPSSGKAAPIRS